MHETSLIEYTFDAVEKRAEIFQVTKVKEIGLVIGRIAAVPVLLETAFDVMKRSRPMFQDTKLVIDFREIRYQCNECGKIVETDSFDQICCPECKSDNLTKIGGDELFIDYFLPADN